MTDPETLVGLWLNCERQTKKDAWSVNDGVQAAFTGADLEMHKAREVSDGLAELAAMRESSAYSKAMARVGG